MRRAEPPLTMLLTAVALSVLCWVGPSLRGQVDGRSPIDAALPRLRALLRDGLDRSTPSANVLLRAERETVFDGSYDWHSSIAAHWAALSIARVERDRELREQVLGRLAPAALQAERQQLNDRAAWSPQLRRTHAYFVPYADAWLLLLLDELHRHHRPDDDALLAFRVETEARVLRALESGAFPEFVPPADRGGRPFCGFYRSWLFGYLMLRLAGPSSDEVGARLDALAADKLAPQRRELAAYRQRHAFDFLDVRALHALVERVDPTVEVPVAFVAPEAFEPLPESVSLRTVHPVGVHVSALWPLACDAGHDEDARAAFERRMEELLDRTDLWADDFEVVSHWVPQFLWFGVWLSRGRP